MEVLSCHTLILGAGPGGYVCAIRAAQAGLDTIIVEAEAEGGTCLNVGCIPSKAMIHASDVFHKAHENAAESPLGIKAGKPKIDLAKTVGWKDGIVKRLTGGVGHLLKKSGARLIKGWAHVVDGKTVTVQTSGGETIKIEMKNLVIATGSRSVEIPSLPYGDKILSSTEALALDAVPDSLVVVGGGYIGLELGIAYAKLGARVTIVEASSQVLPQFDKKLVAPVVKTMKTLGMDVLTDARADGMTQDGSALKVVLSGGEDRLIEAEKILVTVGRRPATEGWGLDDLPIVMDGPFIKIDEHCQTSMTGVYAIGDVTGNPMLAHRAMAQGELVADCLAGKPRSWDKVAVPAICFTDPEIISVGLSEAEAGSEDVIVAEFPFAANGRAMTVEGEDGFVRVIARKSDHFILGLHATGHGVSELTSSFTLAIEMGARLEDIADTIHAHPTMGETVQEAIFKALDRPLHI